MRGIKTSCHCTWLPEQQQLRTYAHLCQNYQIKTTTNKTKQNTNKTVRQQFKTGNHTVTDTLMCCYVSPLPVVFGKSSVSFHSHSTVPFTSKPTGGKSLPCQEHLTATGAYMYFLLFESKISIFQIWVYQFEIGGCLLVLKANFFYVVH